MQETRFYNGIDWLTIFLILCIMAFGVMNIYSVDADYGIKQLVRIALGGGMVVFAIIATSLNRNFFDIYAVVFYLIGVLAMIGVLIFGTEVNGAKAWYRFGGVSIQPVELMKIATGLMVGHFLNIPGISLKESKNVLICFVLIGIPAVLILLQPDVGSLFVFGAFFLAMYREGLNPLFLVLPLFIGAVFIMSLAFGATYFLPGAGVFLYFVLVLFAVFSKNNIQFNSILIGVFIGLIIYFIVAGVYVFPLPFQFNTPTIYNVSSELLAALAAFFMAIISTVTTIILYFSSSSVHSQSSIKRDVNSPQIGFGVIFTLFISVIIFGISSQASSIVDKLPTHQRERIMVLLEGEAKYRDTSGYNLLYSKTAIGSGEMWGSGWNKGAVTDGRFVPEQWTDYIFCTVGEEWGFVGSTVLVLAYCFLIIRLYYLAEKQKSVISRYFGYSVASILLIHFFINIGMVMGLFPTAGIPLPFLSYGGSSLWGFTLMIFIFLKLNYNDAQSYY